MGDLYPDINDPTFNIKIAERKEFDSIKKQEREAQRQTDYDNKKENFKRFLENRKISRLG